MQTLVAGISGALLNIDPEKLDAFLAMISLSQTVAPILDPTLFQQGAGKLREVQVCASALAEARAKIAAVAGADDPYRQVEQ